MLRQHWECVWDNLFTPDLYLFMLRQNQEMFIFLFIFRKQLLIHSPGGSNMEPGFQPPPKVQYDWPDRESMSFPGPFTQGAGLLHWKARASFVLPLGFCVPRLGRQEGVPVQSLVYLFQAGYAGIPGQLTQVCFLASILFPFSCWRTQTLVGFKVQGRWHKLFASF